MQQTSNRNRASAQSEKRAHDKDRDRAKRRAREDRDGEFPVVEEGQEETEQGDKTGDDNRENDVASSSDRNALKGEESTGADKRSGGRAQLVAEDPKVGDWMNRLRKRQRASRSARRCSAKGNKRRGPRRQPTVLTAFLYRGKSKYSRQSMWCLTDPGGRPSLSPRARPLACWRGRPSGESTVLDASTTSADIRRHSASVATRRSSSRSLVHSLDGK